MWTTWIQRSRIRGLRLQRVGSAAVAQESRGSCSECLAFWRTDNQGVEERKQLVLLMMLSVNWWVVRNRTG